MKKKRLLKDIAEESAACASAWEEELARHVAYLPMLCEQAGVTEQELMQAIGIHFYVRKLSRHGGIQ